MGAAVESYCKVSAITSSNGRQYFNVGYTAANYNDVIVLCGVPGINFMQAAKSKNVIIDSVSITHVGTVGVELTYIFLANAGSVAHLPHHTTAKAVDTVWYNQIGFQCYPEPGDIWLTIWPTGYAGTDDMTIIIRGWIEGGGLVEPNIQPVSVEGYKWPLQRRY